MTQLIYKIAPRALWQAAEAKGVFDGAPIDHADGYIHFSTAAQAVETAAKHFAGQDDLVADCGRGGQAGRQRSNTKSRAEAISSRISMHHCRSTQSRGSSPCRSAATASTNFRS